ncbi:site-specific integrase [Aerococcaceae bacterium NML171108]|nr:site-specific integrase [Aerococcaceae bacterium NML171108]
MITTYNKRGVKHYALKAYLGLDPVTGKQINIEKRGFKTKKEAQLFYNRAKLDFENGQTSKENKTITYKQVYHEWLERYKTTVKESTCVKTEKIFNLHILPVLGDIRIAMLSSGYLQKQLNKWYQQFGQYKKVYNYACNVLQYAVVQGYIQSCPSKRVTMPKIKLDYNYRKSTKDYYSREELQTFMQALEKQDSYKWLAFFRLLAFTGIRRGEALALTWNDIRLIDGVVSINKTLAHGYNNALIVQEPKTKASNRTISLDPKTIQILKAWQIEQTRLLLGFGFNARKPHQLLFSKLETNTYLDLATPRNALERICKRHNLPMINIHGFRHTHCSLLFEAGVPMKDVKERLGHSDIQTTMNIYTHVTQDSKDKSAEIFAKFISI